jgi:transposase-like protein
MAVNDPGESMHKGYQYGVHTCPRCQKVSSSIFEVNYFRVGFFHIRTRYICDFCAQSWEVDGRQ